MIAQPVRKTESPRSGMDVPLTALRKTRLVSSYIANAGRYGRTYPAGGPDWQTLRQGWTCGEWWHPRDRARKRGVVTDARQPAWTCNKL